MSPEAEGFHGVPSFFRACCFHAQDPRTGYQHPGFELARHLRGMVEPADEKDIVEEKVAELLECLKRRDDQLTIDWFRREFPKCMRLIPPRRRQRFLLGVRMAAEEGLI